MKVLSLFAEMLMSMACTAASSRAAAFVACLVGMLTAFAPSQGRADQAVFLGVRAPDAAQADEADADDVANAMQALQRGGFVVVFRHGTTVSDESDLEPPVLSDCSTQRNLSSWGRETMEGLGEFLAQRQVHFSAAYSSAMCRAVDTARRLTTTAIVPLAGITMATSGATAGAAAMAMSPEGASASMASSAKPPAWQSQALLELVTTAPAPGTNTLVVTHAPNLVAAFGTQLSGVPEGSAVVFEPQPGASPGYVVRWRLPLWSVAAYARDVNANATKPAAMVRHNKDL